VGQASDFGEDFRLFALVVLPVVLFLGIATALRMDSANHHDFQCVVGMNRIRAAYLEIAPDVERYFVMGTTDDYEGIVRTMALLPDRPDAVNLLSASPVLIAILNAVLIATIIALALIQAGAEETLAMIAGLLGFFLTCAVWSILVWRMLSRLRRTHRPQFTRGGSRAAGLE
jgi:hypothetical protein